MKTIPIALAGHYQQRTTSLAYCLSGTRADGVWVGYTSVDRRLLVGDRTYRPGLTVSSLARAEGLAVNNLETVFLYEDGFDRADFTAGLWSDCEWTLLEVNWRDVSQGANVIGHFVTGNVEPGEQSCKVELRALSQYLQQPIGLVTSKTCRARFADYPSPVPNARCGLDSADFIVGGTLTAATSPQVFRDASRTEAEDWFADGLLRFTAGENAGVERKLKAYAANGTFTTALPFPFAVAVGDEYEAIAGCRKRLEQDCRDKHDNVLNFQGEPHLPGIDQATSVPDADAP